MLLRRPYFLSKKAGLIQGVACVLVPCPFAVRRPTTKRDSTSRSSTACTGLSGDYSPVRSDGGRLCSKACLAISYTACRFKTQTEATHSQNKVGKWWVLDGVATLRSLQGKWRHATARVCSSRSSYTGLHCQAHLIDSLPCFCAGLKVWDPVGKCRRLRLLLRDHLLPESKGRGWGQRIESAALCAVQALRSPVLQHNQRQHGTGFFIKGQPASAPAAWSAHTLAPARSHLLPTRTIAVLLVSSFCKRASDGQVGTTTVFGRTAQGNGVVTRMP
jgi:hypothetical protein